jgi:hypothetical protein
LEDEVWGKGRGIGCLMCALGVNMGEGEEEKAESRKKGIKIGQKGQLK